MYPLLSGQGSQQIGSGQQVLTYRCFYYPQQTCRDCSPVWNQVQEDRFPFPKRYMVYAGSGRAVTHYERSIERSELATMLLISVVCCKCVRLAVRSRGQLNVTY